MADHVHDAKCAGSRDAVVRDGDSGVFFDGFSVRIADRQMELEVHRK